MLRVSVVPFTKTREGLGGYYLVHARDQQEAESVTARHLGNHVGAIEVQSLFDV